MVEQGLVEIVGAARGRGRRRLHARGCRDVAEPDRVPKLMACDGPGLIQGRVLRRLVAQVEEEILRPAPSRVRGFRAPVDGIIRASGPCPVPGQP